MYKTSAVLFFLLHLFIFFHLPQPTPTFAMSVTERTYIMVKVCVHRDLSHSTRKRAAANGTRPLQPDGVQRGLVGNIIGRFEQRGFKLTALKLVHATPEHLEKRTS